MAQAAGLVATLVALLLGALALSVHRDGLLGTHGRMVGLESSLVVFFILAAAGTGLALYAFGVSPNDLVAAGNKIITVIYQWFAFSGHYGSHRRWLW